MKFFYITKANNTSINYYLHTSELRLSIAIFSLEKEVGFIRIASEII